MKISTFLYLLVSGLPLFLVSCGEGDLKKVNSITVNPVTFTKERTLGVEIIYSDSARVKAKGNAPVMDKVTPSTGGSYQEMPKGVKIDFYNPKQAGLIDGTLVADYAIRKEQEQKTIFKKNVVVKNPEGKTFSSEELVWDEIKKIFYSTQQVTVKDTDGNILYGTDFEAPQDFSSYKFNNATGQAKIEGSIAP